LSSSAAARLSLQAALLSPARLWSNARSLRGCGWSGWASTTSLQRANARRSFFISTRFRQSPSPGRLVVGSAGVLTSAGEQREGQGGG